MCGPHHRFAPLRPRTLRRIPQAVGTFTLSFSFSLLFGQGLEMCGPHRRFAPLLPRTLRRIPQAVSTVATFHREWLPDGFKYWCFNTASGKHCCNRPSSIILAASRFNVSIPQAVSTVATNGIAHATTTFENLAVSIPQAVSTVATG